MSNIYVKDPTREDIDAIVAAMPFASEFNEFDKEEAIYWYASVWHNGQSSNLYEVLSESQFKPSPISKGPSEMARLIFDELVNQFEGDYAKQTA